MQINKISGNWLKTFEITKKKEASMAKTAKVTFILFFRIEDFILEQIPQKSISTY